MIDARQLDTFRGNTLGYFEKLAPGLPAPAPGAAFLTFDPPPFLGYAGAVDISGPLSGLIYLTAEAAVLDKLLEINGFQPGSEALRLDMCREISNVISGNASKAFGPSWTISVPRSLGPESARELAFPGATFTLPAEWMGSAFHLVVGLTEHNDANGKPASS